jgi:hypothetical protein
VNCLEVKCGDSKNDICTTMSYDSL